MMKKNITHTDDLASIADALLDAAQRIRSVKMLPSSNMGAEISATKMTPLEKAKQHYRSRRNRRFIFDNSDLFGEPAWDMLVDLFISGEQGYRISVTSLCIASAAPASTAIRYISILENEGMIIRNDDERDARRKFLSLSPETRERMFIHFTNND